MSSIYTNSYLTIAASLAKDTSAGCFNHRAIRKQVRLDYISPEGVRSELLASLFPIWNETKPGAYAEMSGYPLSTRAWALQERLLSRRILHFGKEQTYFECKQGFLGETGLLTTDYYCAFDLSQTTNQETVYDYWTKILFFQYHNRLLTKSSDKLPSLAGLARLFSERLEDDYLAGLWKKSLVKCLFWIVRGASTLSYYRAPSWSWASLDGIASMGFLYGTETLEEYARLIDYYVELKGKNPFGEVKDGWIKLEAPLIPLYLTGRRLANPKELFIPEHPLVRTQDGNDDLQAEFDIEDFMEDTCEDGSKRISFPKSMKIFALVLEKGRVRNYELTYYCLIVSPVEEDGLVMCRLGIIRIEAQKLEALEFLDSSVKWPVVTLI
jgi:hypothetical protein